MIDQLRSEYAANRALHNICKNQGYGIRAFNLSGDNARKALRIHHATNGTGFAKMVAKIKIFFIGV